MSSGWTRTRSCGTLRMEKLLIPNSCRSMQHSTLISSDHPDSAPANLTAYPADLRDIIAALRTLGGRQPRGSERAVAETLNVKRHQLRRALQALRANGEIAPAKAKRKPLVGHNGENLVRATNPMEV